MASRARRFTVRARVTALATTVVLVVLVVAGTAVSARHHDLLVDDLEESLELGADDLARAVADGRGPAPVAGFGDDDAAYQVVGPGGVVEASSTNLGGAPPIAPTPPGDDAVVRTVDGLPHDDAAFLVRSQVVDGRDGPVAVHVAATLDDVDESTDALRASLAGAIPVVGGVLALALWFVVGRALRPVEQIRAEVASIGGADLRRRVPVPGGDDEVARLARTMNGMLERVEAAVAQQQRFVADASHELRSPLTRIRAEIEVDEAHPATADRAATARSTLEEVVGMQAMLGDLLHLARSDAGGDVGPEPGPVALDEVVRGAVDDLVAGTRRTVDATSVDEAIVRGRPGPLRRLVANLLDNADRHAVEVIAVSLTTDAGVATLVVTDDGPGIPMVDRERIFERFTRLDEARTAAAGGTGLGLAIVRDIAERHGGTVAVDDAPGGGSRFVVRLPLAGG